MIKPQIIAPANGAGMINAAVLTLRDQQVYGLDNGAGGWQTGLTTFEISQQWTQKPYFNNDVNDAAKNGNNCLYTSTEGHFLEFEYQGLAPGATVELVWGSMNSSVTNTFITVSGDAEEAQFDLVNEDKNTLPKHKDTIVLTKTSGVFRITQGYPEPGGQRDQQAAFHYISGLVDEIDPNAPDPSGVNFVGSTFVSSDGSLDAGSADWQVTTLADTSYSSIVSEVEKHPDMTDHAANVDLWCA